MATDTATVLQATILAQGLYTKLDRAITSGLTLTPDPWAIPSSSEAGFALPATKTVDVRVTFHAEPGRRSVWLALDTDNAPLTGNYTVIIDGNTVTYNATSSAPADVDALLQGIADAINADGTVGALVVATRVKASSTATSAPYDAVRLTAVASAAVAASGLPAGASYKTFALGACSFPAGADLHIIREVDSATLNIWSKPGYNTDSVPSGGLSGIASLQRTAWVLGGNGQIVLSSAGYDERMDFASRSAIFLGLSDAVVTDSTFTIVASGVAGIVTVTNQVIGVAAYAYDPTT